MNDIRYKRGNELRTVDLDQLYIVVAAITFFHTTVRTSLLVTMTEMHTGKRSHAIMHTQDHTTAGSSMHEKQNHYYEFSHDAKLGCSSKIKRKINHEINKIC